MYTNNSTNYASYNNIFNLKLLQFLLQLKLRHSDKKWNQMTHCETTQLFNKMKNNK